MNDEMKDEIESEDSEETVLEKACQNVHVSMLVSISIVNVTLLDQSEPKLGPRFVSCCLVLTLIQTLHSQLV